MEHLRVVYGVLTDDRLSQREFQKKAARCGVSKERKRVHGASRHANTVMGVVTAWKLEADVFNEVTGKYFDDKDRKLLAVS
jgi:hypothetical protein